IIAAVPTKVRSANLRLHELGRRTVRRRGQHGGRQLLRDFRCEAWTGENDDGMRADFLLDDFGHPQQRSAFETLRRADEDGAVEHMRRGGAQDGAAPMRRYRYDDETGAFDRGSK